MSIVAICAVADMVSVNESLAKPEDTQGYFTVPVFDGRERPSHATLHAWDDADLLAALQADSRVTVNTSEIGTPRDRVQALIDAQGLQWPGTAPLLPDTGTVQPGGYYWTVEGDDTRFWRIIQRHDRGVFGGDPTQYPALIREARIPGQVREWRQPLDQFDAYLTVDPFTGKPERVTHNGKIWKAVQGSAGGPDGAQLNTWAPGVFGWVQV